MSKEKKMHTVFTLDTSRDDIVENVIYEYRERSKKGQEKYGTTLAENNKDDYLQHLKEELMDATLYIQKLQEQLKSNKNK